MNKNKKKNTNYLREKRQYQIEAKNHNLKNIENYNNKKNKNEIKNYYE